MKANVYSIEGKKVSDITLPKEVFDVAWNADLVHEVVVSMQSNARAGTADAKDRSEVRGGGKKPWKQKGTGRARHGSRRSPIWTGGGVTHGPLSEKDYSKKINKKVRAKALATVLSKKNADKEILFVDAFGFEAPKAADAKNVITALGSIKGSEMLSTKRKNAALIVLPSRDENVERSFRNFGNVVVSQAKDINPVDLLTFKYVIVAEPEAALEIFETRVGSSAKAK
ncbi:50S ribosomal protein L4 [Candidatus Kaiserbacteria bacterium]|nr:50S ribosomal protein L4 [Candidatus Kaiserbacteria bacterium]